MDDFGFHNPLPAGGEATFTQPELIDPTLASTQAFNNDFSSWLPRYNKPDLACDYCLEKQLDCFTLFEGQTSCSPCSALFRHCSFNRTGEEPVPPRGAINTLHLVPEDVCQELGTLTGIKSLKSKLVSSLDLHIEQSR
jgi:hypothetical protein